MSEIEEEHPVIDPMRMLAPGDTVLVTGASGSIGVVVVPQLAEAGFRVIATGRHPFDAPEADKVLVGDPRDAEWAARAVRGGDEDGEPVDGIVHLAAIAAPGRHPDDVLFATNVGGAYAILDAAGRAGVRTAVVASSFSAYGYPWAGRHMSPEYVPIDEAEEAVPIDPYGLSKIVVEQICAFAVRRWGMPTVALRMPFVGHGERIRWWLERVKSDPDAMQQELWAWIDPRDVGRAIIAGLTRGVTGYHLLNIAAPDSTVDIPTRELMARCHPTTRIVGDLDGYASVVDCRRAAEVLGFTPTYSWRSGNALT